MSPIDEIITLEQREIFREENPSVLRKWINEIDSAMDDLPRQRELLLTQLGEVNRRRDSQRISDARKTIDDFKEHHTSK